MSKRPTDGQGYATNTDLLGLLHNKITYFITLEVINQANLSMRNTTGLHFCNKIFIKCI